MSVDFPPHSTPSTVSERLATAGNPVYYYAFDGLGSVSALTDSSGAAPALYSYEPYGETTASGSAPNTHNPWRYASSYLDSTGFYKMGMRYYRPELMRWTQQDPLEQPTDAVQAMRYGYAGADPINRADPTGQSIGDVWDDVRDVSEDVANEVQEQWNGVKRFMRSAPGRCLTYGAIGAGGGWIIGGAAGGTIRNAAGGDRDWGGWWLRRWNLEENLTWRLVALLAVAAAAAQVIVAILLRDPAQLVAQAFVAAATFLLIGIFARRSKP